MLAGAVTAAALIGPAVVAMAAGLLTSSLLGRPGDGAFLARWWYLQLAVPAVAFVLADRAARRLLPLAALLRMTLVFPDRAPARLLVARRAASTRQLERAVASGAQDDRTEAAVRILLLVTELNRHDRLTRGHSERVRAYTDLLADQLRLPAADRDRLRWAAMLHDVGKTRVPATLLNKAGRPDPGEWEVLRSHPAAGAELAAPLAEWLGPWFRAIPEHHERWDGTGYPLGLRGTEISPAGRIVAVADSYEAMTAARSYSKPMTHEAARKELAASAGSHFDPDVVRAFLGASLGGARLLAGPLALLGQIPAVNQLPRLGQLISASSAAVGGVATAAVVAVGAAHHLSPPTAATPTAAHAAPAHAAAPAPPAVAPAAPPTTAWVPAPGPTTPTTAPAVAAASVAGGQTTAVTTGSTDTTTTTTAPTTPVGPPDGPTTVVGPSTTVPLPSRPATSPTTAAPVTSSPTTAPTTAAPAPTVPGAPGGLVAAVDAGQVSLSWQAPADGGSPLTGYTVQATTGTGPASSATVAASATSYVLTGLQPATTYTVTVLATNAVGSGPGTSTSATTPDVPGAPNSPAATGGDGTATVTWGAPTTDGGSPVQLYLVTVGTPGGATTTVVPAPATTATVGGLVDGTSYDVTVQAVNAVGAGADSAAAPVTPYGAPGAPLVTEVVAGTATVTVDWQAPAADGGSPLLGYTAELLQGTAVLGTTSVAAGTTTATFALVPVGVPLTVQVTAQTAHGTSTPGTGGPVTASPVPDPVPGQPTGLSAAPGDRQATLTWTDPATTAGVDRVVVTPYVGGVAQAPIDLGPASPSTTSVAVPGLADGTAYTFTVALANASGVGPASAPSGPVTPGGVPSAPGSVTTTSGDQEVVVSWSAASGGPVTGYVVTPEVGGTPHPELAVTAGAATTAVVVPNLANGTTYTFSVVATAAAGTGPAATSGPVAPSRVPGSTPGAPTKPTVLAGDTQLTATWSEPPLGHDVGPVVSWTVTAQAGGQPTVSVLVPASETTTTIPGLTDGVAYTVTVTAVNAAGSGGRSGGSEPATPGLPPGAPTSLVVGDSGGHLSASWAPGPTGTEPTTSYTVTLQAGTADPHSWKVDGGRTSQDLGSVAPGTPVTVTVTASDASGTSAAATTSLTA